MPKSIPRFLLLIVTFLILDLVSAHPPLQTGGRKHGLKYPKFDLARQKDREFIIEPRFRLPNDSVNPVSYELNVVPILNEAPEGFTTFTAPGSVKIVVNALTDVDKIHLHKDVDFITVSDIKVSRVFNGEEVPVLGADYDANGLYVINLGASLITGAQYEIFLEYVAQINNFRRGLFRAEYTDANGVQKWLAATHFETISYRKMAIGFDEPHLKAVFNINIGRMTSQMSLSNSDVKEVGVEDPNLRPLLPPGYVWDKYNPTVRMSTYLVAITVSDFVPEQADESIYGKPVKIYGQPELMSRGAGIFTANRSAELLKYFGDTFKIDYAMPKFDSFAVPRLYFPGAMENYGLNIYGDGALLYIPGETLEVERESVAVTLSHEISHQWFGNLVTCAWWSNLWLNEGFANYISYLGSGHTNPEYDADGSLLYDVVFEAQAFDVTEGSHPVLNEGSQEMVEGMTIFDTITYGKGGALIRMMEGFLSRETLIAGLVQYLERRKFGVAEQDDLFGELNEVAHAENKLPQGVDLKTVMDTYTVQKGLPLVRVTVVSPTRVYISQEDYATAQNSKNAGQEASLWEIPIALATEDEPDFTNHTPKYWMTQNEVVISLTHDTTKWLILNPDGFSYYKVLYDSNLTILIQSQLDSDHSVISSMTKAQLIDDYFRFADSGFVTYPVALGMTKFLGSSSLVADHHVFWYPVLDSLRRIFPIISTSTTALSNFRKYFLPKVESALNQTGWTPFENEHGVNVLLRTLLADWACALGSSQYNELANGLLAIWTAVPEHNPVPLDLQVVLYCTAIANGPQSNFDFILEQYKLGPTALGQRTRLLKALTCTQDSANLDWLLQNALDLTQVRAEDVTVVLQGVGQNSAGRERTVKFVSSRWAEIVDHTATDPEKLQTTVVPDVVDAISLYQNTAVDLTNLRNLMVAIRRDNPTYYDLVITSLQASYDRISANLHWTTTNLDAVNAWLVENV